MAFTYAYADDAPIDSAITIYWTDGETDCIIEESPEDAALDYACLICGTNPVSDGWDVYLAVHDPDIEFAGQLVATDDPAYFATHNDGTHEWWQRSTPGSRLGRDFLALLDDVDF